MIRQNKGEEGTRILPSGPQADLPTTRSAGAPRTVNTPEEALAHVARLPTWGTAAPKPQNGVGTAEIADRHGNPSEGADCVHEAFRAAMRRERRTCHTCRRLIADAEIVRYGFSLVRYGAHAGRRGLTLNLLCSCGRSVRMLWKLAPTADGDR